MSNNDDVPLWFFILILVGFTALIFYLGYDYGSWLVEKHINDGTTLLKECQPVMIEQIVQGQPVQVQEWYCKVGD